MEDPPRKPGRPPKYDWDDKRDICYQLYVVEKKSVPQIIDHFAKLFDVPVSELPSHKSFFRQIGQIWRMPARVKRLTPEEQPVVMARIKELWEQNVLQRDIKQTLAEEGWEVNGYEFNKLWRKLGLRLRYAEGYQLPGDRTGQKKKRKRPANAPDDPSQAVVSDEQFDAEMQAAAAGVLEPLAAPMGPEEAFMRQQRLLELQLESDERLQARKRRRRIRGFGKYTMLEDIVLTHADICQDTYRQTRQAQNHDTTRRPAWMSAKHFCTWTTIFTNRCGRNTKSSVATWTSSGNHSAPKAYGKPVNRD